MSELDGLAVLDRVLDRYLWLRVVSKDHVLVAAQDVLALLDRELDLRQLVAWQTLPQADELVDLDLAVEDSFVALPLFHDRVVVQMLGFEGGVGDDEHGELDVVHCGALGQSSGLLFVSIHIDGQFLVDGVGSWSHRFGVMLNEVGSVHHLCYSRHCVTTLSISGNVQKYLENQNQDNS